MKIYENFEKFNKYLLNEAKKVKYNTGMTEYKKELNSKGYTPLGYDSKVGQLTYTNKEGATVSVTETGGNFSFDGIPEADQALFALVAITQVDEAPVFYMNTSFNPQKGVKFKKAYKSDKSLLTLELVKKIATNKLKFAKGAWLDFPWYLRKNYIIRADALRIGQLLDYGNGFVGRADSNQFSAVQYDVWRLTDNITFNETWLSLDKPEYDTVSGYIKDNLGKKYDEENSTQMGVYHDYYYVPANKISKLKSYLVDFFKNK